MSTTYKHYPNIHPEGLDEHSVVQEYIAYTNRPIGAHLGVIPEAKLFGKLEFPRTTGGQPYASANWTATATGTSAANAVSAKAGYGYKATCGSTSTFYGGIQSLQKYTPVANKRFSAWAVGQWSHATQIGFNFGFGNTQADPTNTEYTDFIGFRKAPTSASVFGTVIGNSGSVTQTAAALITTSVAATEYVFGFWADLQTTAALSSGAFYFGTDPFALTETPMTQTLLTEFIKFLTTPPTDMALTCFCTGTTGNAPTADFAFVGEIGR